jgi:hypothetical protein
MMTEPASVFTASGAFAEPSSGLEPETPSLPCASIGNWTQATATVLACFRGFCAGGICHPLPPVATTGLHKGSIQLVPREAEMLHNVSGEVELLPALSDVLEV